MVINCIFASNVQTKLPLTPFPNAADSVVTVQRAFRAKYTNDPPTDKTIRVRYKQFTETGCLCKQKAPMLTRVWQELEYRIDVCRVTGGAHIEHL